jgi:ribosomal protein S12 methylthiotransferase accessory factor YcaO
VRHADGRVWLARQPDRSFDAVVVDAFLGARIPHRLITAQAFTQAARVTPLTLVNVVDDRARRQVGAVLAALATAFPCTWTLGVRAGNTICVGTRLTLPLSLIAAGAAADPDPAALSDTAVTEAAGRRRDGAR